MMTRIELNLTEEELAVLLFLVMSADPSWGEPLKDGDFAEQDPYATLATLKQKLAAARQGAV